MNMSTVEHNALEILLVDDDADICRALGELLLEEDYRVHVSENGLQALEVLGRERVDVVITDVRMPRMDGFELLERARRQWPDIEVIVVTAYGDVESAVRALREGAFDFFTKPFDMHDIIATLERTARFCALRRENERFRKQLDRMGSEARMRYGVASIVGESAQIEEVRQRILQVARTEATTVLIEGETGTGKELVARAIHYESARVGGPLVEVDCTAIPENLIESELFGHVKGAFTDAREERQGRFEQAHGGTLFLDEIGDMALEMQSKLLRTLEGRWVQRVGGSTPIPVDVRVVSAANRDLRRAIEEEMFRTDLYYRLNTFTIRLPLLRDRPGDILPLARYFLQNFTREQHREIGDFAPETQALLLAHSFPGNVRELRNMIERATILCRGECISAGDLELGPAQMVRPEPVVAVPVEPEILNLDELEKRAILRAMEICGGKRAQAIQLLGISKDTLRRRLDHYGLEV